ncbi:hypothetical protein [Qipengyuania sp.]|uniref:hypothetical protein n=1 Tax=Qipengyuania sp. TaxID=2004515 RepID=UPI0035C840B4
MRAVIVAFVAAVTLLTSGCVAKTLVDVATLPVRAGAKAIDLATTSQSEADEKRGRALRKREERLGKLEREYAKQSDRCKNGSRAACEDARATYAEIQELLPTIPVEPKR